jgi:hypothetical protein
MVRLAHLADIHIQDRRRAEYAAVFGRLYASLRKESPDLIVVAGDVFDNKMRASPHNLEDVAAFLSALADIAPVILIAGNHDTNCLTPGALDLLTPLIAEHRMLRAPRLTYWRNSGVYEAHGITWVVIATDGETPPEARAEASVEARAEPATIRICLFHEEVAGAVLPGGLPLPGAARLSAQNFAGFDAALGGHIHVRQHLGPRAAYCGSLVQQNIGESHHGHGYLLWEVNAGAMPVTRGVDIPNGAGFVRIEVDSTGADVTVQPVPTAPLYWEVIHDGNAPPEAVTAIVAGYEARYGAPRATRVRESAAPAAAAAAAAVGAGGAIAALARLTGAQAASRQQAAHEEIIRELLAEEPDGIAEAVIALHRARWTEPRAPPAGGRFRLVRFAFDNMYAFGAGNVVDFTALEGCVSGVVAPNFTGKSSLIEALLFTLYEEHPRAPSKKDVIRRGASSARAVLDFELDGRPGRIVKGLTASNTRAGESAYRFEYAGENRTRGGTMETLAEIESVLGNATGALASSFQLQGGEAGGFMGASPAARKKLVAEVLSLGSFETLERSTTKELTECGGEVRALGAQFRGETVAVLEERVACAVGDLDDAAAELHNLETAAAAAAAAATAAAAAAGLARGLADAARDAGGTPAIPGDTATIPDDVTPEELSAPPPPRPLPPWRGPIPRLAELEAAAAAAAAMPRLSPVAAAAHITSEQMRPRPSPAEVAEAGATLAAAPAPGSAEPEPELAEPGPAEPELVPFPELGARRGAEPSPEAVAAAAAVWAAPRPPEERAARWDESEFNRITAEAHLDPVAVTVARCDAALQRAAPSLAAAAATRAAAAAALNDTECREKAAAAVELVRAGLRPVAGCEGCTHATKFIAGVIPAAVELEAARKALLDATTAERAAAATVTRIKRLRELIGARECEARLAAQATLESANYWAAQRAAQRTADRARAVAAAVAERARAVAILEAANYWAGVDQLQKIAAAAEMTAERRDRIAALVSRRRAADAERAAVAAAATAVAAEAKSSAASAHRSRAAHTVAVAASAVERLRAELATEEERAERFHTASARAAAFKAYRAVLRPVGGIGDRLLERARGALEAYINAAARELGAAFRVGLEPDYGVRIITDTISVPASLGSGYQRFVLSLAARWALWRLTTTPRPDAIIIDEGFGACDDMNLDSMATALEALAAAPDGPRLIFVVSHVEELKARVARTIEIEVRAAALGSRIRAKDTVAGGGAMAAAMAGAGAAVGAEVGADVVAGAPLGAPLGLPPDPNCAGNVFCAPCSQSLRPSWAARHLASAKHAAKAQKKQG